MSAASLNASMLMRGPLSLARDGLARNSDVRTAVVFTHAYSRLGVAESRYELALAQAKTTFPHTHWPAHTLARTHIGPHTQATCSPSKSSVTSVAQEIFKEQLWDHCRLTCCRHCDSFVLTPRLYQRDRV